MRHLGPVIKFMNIISLDNIFNIILLDLKVDILLAPALVSPANKISTGFYLSISID